MKYKVVIPGRFADLNEYIKELKKGRGKWQPGNEMKQNDQGVIAYHLRKQLKKARIVPPVYIRYLYIEKDRRRDKDNVDSYFRKIFQDALVKAGYLKNDGWKYISGSSNEYDVDPKNPRIEVTIIDGTE